MFDKLVESTKTKSNYRSGRIFILTGLLYATLLTTLGVWTILGLNPGLAESFELTTLAPPVPVGPPPPPTNQLARVLPQAAPSFRPAPPTAVIPNPLTVPPLGPLTNMRVVNTGLPPGDYAPAAGNFVSGSLGNAVPPPPPEPKPKPTPEPAVKPTPAGILKVSGGVAEGKAIRKIAPQYTAIARAARASGPVQIQVMISEEGQVIEATVLNGHPLLRQAALEAARQWLFRPTLLSDVPVKVQGVLTFNFTLN